MGTVNSLSQNHRGGWTKAIDGDGTYLRNNHGFVYSYIRLFISFKWFRFISFSIVSLDLKEG